MVLVPFIGHDISAHQVNFDVFRDRREHPFLGLKQTEGLTWPDQDDEEATRLLRRYRVLAAEAAYDLVILYHYAKPQPGRSGRQEADHFIAFVGDLRPREAVALDLEENHGLSRDGAEDFALAFVDRIEERYPSLRGKVILYAGPGFLGGISTGRLVQRCPLLWVAHYFDDRTTNHQPGLDRWDTYTFWQFTDTPLDINVFQGSIDQLRALASGGTARSAEPSRPKRKERQMFFFWHVNPPDRPAVYLAVPPWRSPHGLPPEAIDPLVAQGVPLIGKDGDKSAYFDLLSPDRP